MTSTWLSSFCPFNYLMYVTNAIPPCLNSFYTIGSRSFVVLLPFSQLPCPTLGRISKFLQLEELLEPYLLDYGMKHAVKVDGDFSWEVAGSKIRGNGFFGKDGKKRPDAKPKLEKQKSSKSKELVLPTVAPKIEKEKEEEEEKLFELRDLKFSVPKDSFVAIVGRVGSGKVCFPPLFLATLLIYVQSSLLQALV